MQEETYPVIDLRLVDGKLEFSTNIPGNLIVLLGMLERGKYVVNSGQLQQPKPVNSKIKVPHLTILPGGQA